MSQKIIKYSQVHIPRRPEILSQVRCGRQRLQTRVSFPPRRPRLPPPYPPVRPRPDRIRRL